MSKERVLTESVSNEKPRLSKRAMMRAAKMTGVVLLAGSTLTGCFDLGQRRPEDAAAYPSNTASASGRPGQVPIIAPGPHGVGVNRDFIKAPDNDPKSVEHIGADVCPWTPDTPSVVSSVDISFNGNSGTMTAATLDLRCADFPGQKNGMPKDESSKTKHFIGFERPTTEANVIDLGQPEDLNRSEYMSGYVGVCAVEGELFKGTDGSYSRTWLAVFEGGENQTQAAGFVPYAEAGYVSGDQANPLRDCQTR